MLAETKVSDLNMDAVSSIFDPEPWSFGELFDAVLQAPMYHIIAEVLLVLFIIRLILAQSYSIETSIELTEKEKQELIDEWVPESLVPDPPMSHPALKYRVVSKQGTASMVVDGKEGVNMGTLNFLGMLGRSETEEAAITSLKRYGVGSCGPRGFFGTIDVHLTLEDKLAQFIGTEQCILYSYGFSTIASAIPAYAKKGDLIYCDEGVNFAVQMGLLASRSKLKFFKHNDMEHLKSLLEEQEAEDKKNPKKAKVTRKFLVVEGLYGNYGDIAPIKQLIEFKYKYKVRIFMDESYSFGVLGKTGKGVTEHANQKITDIDLICVSMEMAIGTMGGFCVGSKYLVDHQVLSGMGYCFSASLPPMLAAAASAAIDILEKDSGICERLQKKSKLAHRELSKIDGIYIPGIDVAPIKHLRLQHPSGDNDADLKVLQTVVDKALDKGVVLTVSRYLVNEESFLPPPSIRVAINVDLTDDVIRDCTKTIQDVFKEVLASRAY